MKTRRSHLLTMAGLIACLTISALFITTTGHAAFSKNFDELLPELQSRRALLSTSTDKVGKKQFKAVNKSIAAINKPGAASLTADLNTAAKVNKTLAKAFPVEFSTSTYAPIFTNNLSVLLSDVLAGIESDIRDAVAGLQAAADLLPAGPTKDSVLAAIADAQAALDQADQATDFETYISSLGDALIAVAAGVDALTSGLGICNDSTLSMTVDGVPKTFDLSDGAFVVSTGQFATGGVAGTPIPSDVLALVVTSGVTGPGTYSLSTFSSFITGSLPLPAIYYVTSGTLTITALDTVNKTADGTFTFNAIGTGGTITVTQGLFHNCGIDVTP